MTSTTAPPQPTLSTHPAVTCRLLIDPPAEGAWNMAVDEMLLEAAESRGHWSLRFYQWSEPTLSLGYFQSIRELGDRWQHTALVRRSSGGGAIVHDAELTYSLAVPPNSPLARQPLRLYEAVHLGIVACLEEFGIDATLCQSPVAAPRKNQPLLCFGRRSSGDILVGEAKICGSAQRRRRGAVLQHGSIVLRTSPLAPEITGLDEIANVRIDPAEFADAMTQELAERLCLDIENGQISAGEIERAEAIASIVYASKTRLRRR